MPRRSPPAGKEQLLAFFATLERELERVEFFRPPEKRATMTINLRNIFTRMEPTQQDIQTLHGVIMAIAEGRKGPAQGGILDGREAGPAARRFSPSMAAARCRANAARCAACRACCAAIRPTRNAAYGMRSPATAASPAAASSGKCRSVPISSIWCRFRCAPSSNWCRKRKAPMRPRPRHARRGWLAARDYRVREIATGAVEADVAAVLDALAREFALEEP